jgi:flagellar biosynthesis protein FlhF
VKIKKFLAPTEALAIDMVKDEFGLDALVLNIKRIQPRGLFAAFKKPQVEVTAAYDDTKPIKTDAAPDEDEKEREVREKLIEAAKKPQREKQKSKVLYNEDADSFSSQVERTTGSILDKRKDEVVLGQKRKIADLEEMLVTREETIRRVEKQLMVSAYKIIEGKRKYRNNIVQVFYDTLVRQGVKDDIAEYILKDLDLIEENDKIDINFIVRIVYNNIVSIISDSEGIDPAGHMVKGGRVGAPRVVAFIGSTGVGKTTTIAKISADLILNHGKNVGLITADTYRIAAVEQLRVYAEILGVEIGVVYSPDDLAQFIKVMGEINDVLLIDTAGRSHKHRENLMELGELLESAPGCEKYLTISLTTKYEDMLDIVNTYSDITEFGIIFTKLDETLSLGSVINLCYDTGKKIVYITYGQNVPDDIRSFTAEEVARAVLSQFS